MSDVWSPGSFNTYIDPPPVDYSCSICGNSRGSTGWCGIYDDRGYRCTRPAGHRGDHVICLTTSRNSYDHNLNQWVNNQRDDCDHVLNRDDEGRYVSIRCFAMSREGYSCTRPHNHEGEHRQCQAGRCDRQVWENTGAPITGLEVYNSSNDFPSALNGVDRYWSTIHKRYVGRYGYCYTLGYSEEGTSDLASIPERDEPIACPGCSRPVLDTRIHSCRQVLEYNDLTQALTKLYGSNTDGPMTRYQRLCNTVLLDKYIHENGMQAIWDMPVRMYCRQCRGYHDANHRTYYTLLPMDEGKDFRWIQNHTRPNSATLVRCPRCLSEMADSSHWCPDQPQREFYDWPTCANCSRHNACPYHHCACVNCNEPFTENHPCELRISCVNCTRRIPESEMPAHECPTCTDCGAVTLPNGHRCPPVWRLWTGPLSVARDDDYENLRREELYDPYGNRITEYAYHEIPAHFVCLNEQTHVMRSDPAWRHNFPDLPDNQMYYGLEVEVRCPNVAVIENIWMSSGLGWSSHDSSVSIENDGWPITYERFLESNYAETLQTMAKYGARAWDVEGVGLHIHMSKAAFGRHNTHTSRKLHQIIFCMALENMADELRRLGGRGDVRHAQWPTHCSPAMEGSEANVRIIKASQILAGRSGPDAGHYSAIHVAPPKTIELRFARGSMNPRQVYGLVSLLNAIFRWSRTMTMNEIHAGKLTYARFMQWVPSNAPVEAKYIMPMVDACGKRFNRYKKENA